MTLPAIVNTARTLSYYNTLQDITANNLANASSDGFKGDVVTAHSLAGQPHPVPVESIDLRQGDLRDTGRPLDVALQGQGFTVIQTPNGERLTRGGSLAINSQGTLVDTHGDPILGTGGPIQITGNRVDIKPDGTIVVDGTVAGKLRLETVADPATLTKEGAGRFVASGPTTDVTDVGVHQGTLEDSNVNSLLGSVDLIMIQRAYASSVDALKTMDGVLGEITQLGSV
ncbi:MAG TPA: flagellar hook-basal body complex protein [Gemmatimonadales bacterium]|jgi:flagellar basal body rod protein FlgG